MKAIQYVINSILPEDIRDYNRTYDSKSMNDLQALIAEKYPDRYRELVDKLMDISRKAGYYSGQTLRLSDFKPPFDKDAELDKMHNEIQSIRDNVKDEQLKNKAIMEVYERYATDLEKKTMDAAKQNNNNLYSAVSSGARGSPFQLKAMITTPALYTDYKGKTIPYFVNHSFGEGLSIPEYLASTYGTRAATIAIKKSTAKFGGLGKELNRAATPISITSKHDVSNNGIDLPIDDASLYGRVLARPAAGFQPGTIVDRDVLNKLQASGLKTVIVHSPIATISAEGIPAEAFGLDYNKRLPKVGDFHAGILATTTLSEPLIQGGLSSKHEAGGFKGKKRTFSGFNYIQQFLESPKQYKSKAPLAESDGIVKKIYDAPQGGKYIVIGDNEYYVEPDLNIEVKPGQEVEQGDQLADGLIDLDDVVRLRGIGEGRKAFVEVGKQLLDDSGAPAHKRNLEVLARGAVDKVEITDPDGLGDYLPGDIVSYNALEASYTPPENTKRISLDNRKELKGKYLQKPVLHYSIGTKVSNKMIDKLKETGITDAIDVSDQEPGFTPIYVRMREVPLKGNRDFLERAVAPYQAKNYVEAAVRGYKTNIKHNIDPFVRMSQPDFASNVEIKGEF